MEAKRSGKKTRAAVIAGTLAAAIALTGTLAWRNMSQEQINEFRMDKNPGGRIHDDFNGLANKDIYAENFTDEDTGAPVFVRVKFLEYMEIGEEAGINRTDAATGSPVAMADRKVKPLVADADINDVDTWYLHKPDTDEAKDPFHEYWKWDQDGNTVYMPTFNKNKDSISVDVNGTYVGSNGIFDDVDPYDDYTVYFPGNSESGPAYYDADDNEDDEYLTLGGPAPGAGGTKKNLTATPPVTAGNYVEESEQHFAQSTLNGLGIMTMQEWLDAGNPICNKWVWDTDGWFYWPEPVMPQTATGLVLDKVIQGKTLGEKCYYAIEMVGQFASANDWGDKNSTDDKVKGFYVDNFTDNAKALLDQAAAVVVGKNGGWYLPKNEAGVYQQIMDDNGTLGGLVCVGEDGEIDTADDRKDVLYVDGDGITVGIAPNEKKYGHYFLPPTATENYYRAPGSDGLLGTADDDRLWVADGGSYPTGMTDTVVTSVIVYPPADAVSAGTDAVEMEAGGDPFVFEAVVMNGTAEEFSGVTWTLTGASESGTKVTVPDPSNPNKCELTVDANETTGTKTLLLTATSKKDDRVSKTYTIQVYGKLNVVVNAPGGIFQMAAGNSMQLSANVMRGRYPLSPQPAVTWKVSGATSATSGPNAISIDENSGKLYVGRGVSVGKVTVTATYKKDPSDPTGVDGTQDITITPPAPVTIDLTPKGTTSIEPGSGTLLTFTAKVSDPGSLADASVKWEVGKKDTSGSIVYPASGIDGVSISTVADPSAPLGESKIQLTVGSDYSIDDDGLNLYVRATANDPAAGGAQAVSDPINVVAPDHVTIKRLDGRTRGIYRGETIEFEATVWRSATTEYKGQDVEWTVTVKDPSGAVIPSGTSGVTYYDGVNASGKSVLTVTVSANQKSADGPIVTEGTQIEVTAASTVRKGVKVQTTPKVELLTINSVELYVLYTDDANHRALVLTSAPIASGVYSNATNGNSWHGERGNDPVAYNYVTNWINNSSRSTLKSMIWTDSSGNYASFKNREGVTLTTFFNYNDPAFFLSETDCFGTMGRGTSSPVADDYTVVDKDGNGVQLNAPNDDSWIVKASSTSHYGCWTRTSHPEGGVSFPKNVATCDPFGNCGSQPVNVSRYYRPAMWLDTNKVEAMFGFMPKA